KGGRVALSSLDARAAESVVDSVFKLQRSVSVNLLLIGEHDEVEAASRRIERNHSLKLALRQGQRASVEKNIRGSGLGHEYLVVADGCQGVVSGFVEGNIGESWGRSRETCPRVHDIHVSLSHYLRRIYYA